MPHTRARNAGSKKSTCKEILKPTAIFINSVVIAIAKFPALHPKNYGLPIESRADGSVRLRAAH